MEITYIDENINALVIDNTYNDEQVRLIKKELIYFNEPHRMSGPDITNSAMVQGVYLKKNTGVFLDKVFQDYKHSDIISNALNTFRGDTFIDEVVKHNSIFRLIKYLRGMTTLISYYENSDYYKPHKDNAVFTIVTYFFNEPKKFSGGDIVLYSDNNDKKVNIEIKNNRSVVFPSCTDHEVTPIKLESNNHGDGRYSISHFIFTSPDQNRI